MSHPTPRLFKLLSLLQSQRFWSGHELASHLEVTQRTLRRDIDKVRSMGYVVHASPGVAGGYQLAPGSKLPPLQLDDDEALAVSLALRGAARNPIAGCAEAAIRALVKLEHLLPGRLRERVKVLRGTVVHLGNVSASIDAETLIAIAAACEERKLLTFFYTKRDGASQKRVVEPLGIVDAGYRWYFVGWDTARNDWRTFRVDRIAGEVSGGARFTPRVPPLSGNLGKFVAEALSTNAYDHRATVILGAPALVIRERIPPGGGVVEALNAQTCRLRVGAQSLDTLAIWILLLGVDFTVEEPPELLEHLTLLRARIDRTLTAAKAPAKSARRKPQGEGRRTRRV